MQKAWKGKPIQFLAVNTDPPASMGRVRAFVRRVNLPLTVLMDQGSRLMKQLNPKGNLPFYVIFDKKGTLVDSHQGYQPGDEAQIKAKLLRFLQE